MKSQLIDKKRLSADFTDSADDLCGNSGSQIIRVIGVICGQFLPPLQPFAIFAAFARMNARLICGSELNSAAFLQKSFAFAASPLP